jgi:hypothetical protein
MCPLVVGKHHGCIVGQLPIPLTLGNEDPAARLAQAALQDGREKRLRVADEADLGPAETGLLPKQAHQTVCVGPGRRIAPPIGDQKQSRLLRWDAPLIECLQELAREALDEERVRRIDGVVVNGNRAVATARCAQLLSKQRSLPNIQLKCGGQEKELGSLVADASIDHLADEIRAGVFSRTRRQAGQADLGCHAERASRQLLKCRGLGLRTHPGRSFRPKVSRDDNDDPHHAPPAQIFSRPPMRLFFTITARVSTITRAPSREVMSALS